MKTSYSEMSIGELYLHLENIKYTDRFNQGEWNLFVMESLKKLMVIEIEKDQANS